MYRGHATSLGLSVVLDLERGLDLNDLRERVSDYAIVTDYDDSLNVLQRRTGTAIDFMRAAHRTALLAWLRQWGCRHLDLASEATSAAALRTWARQWVPELPDPARPLTKLNNDDITILAIAYAKLSSMVAGARRRATGDVAVTFGPTAAAKAVYALRPNACAPWDDPIRHALGMGGNDAAYRAYLHLVARALTNTADRAGITVARLPGKVGRPESSPPKLIDEYLWMRITRGAA